MLTADRIRERIAELQAAHDQHIANANATHGAIQALRQLLAEAEQENAPGCNGVAARIGGTE